MYLGFGRKQKYLEREKTKTKHVYTNRKNKLCSEKPSVKAGTQAGETVPTSANEVNETRLLIRGDTW